MRPPRRPRPVDTTRGPAHGIVWMLALYGILGAGALGWLCFSCATAHAAELPCGILSTTEAAIAWRVPASADPIAHYRLYAALTQDRWTDAIGVLDIPAQVAPAGTRLTAEVAITLPADRPVFVALTAIDAEGDESARSNVLTVPAVSRQCPPPPPPSPTPSAPVGLEMRGLTVALPDGTLRTVTAEEIRRLLLEMPQP